MNLKEGEVITDEVKMYGTPREEEIYNFYSNRKDRRNYYFFNLLKLHKYGNVEETFKYYPVADFAMYEFTLLDMIDYFSEEK